VAIRATPTDVLRMILSVARENETAGKPEERDGDKGDRAKGGLGEMDKNRDREEAVVSVLVLTLECRESSEASCESSSSCYISQRFDLRDRGRRVWEGEREGGRQRGKGCENVRGWVGERDDVGEGECDEIRERQRVSYHIL
jgi:hypothetical protein